MISRKQLAETAVDCPRRASTSSDSQQWTTPAEKEPLDTSSRWPVTTYFILVVEFCERFCYYGLRSVLTMYLTRYLVYDKSSSSTLYHFWLTLCYIFPLIGAVISDSYWGRFHTIWRFSLVYFLGTLLLTASSIPTFMMLTTGATRDIHRYLAIGGLVFIAAGSGGIKPCVSPFGADQFDRYAKRAKESYFKWFYLLINFGGLISAYLTPYLRNEFDCYADISARQAQEQLEGKLQNTEMTAAFDECHIAAYGVPSSLMLLAIVAFLLPQILKNTGLIGKGYKLEPTKTGDNILIGFCKNVIMKEKSGNRCERNSYYQVLKIGMLFLPLSVFWSVFEQIGSIWTFQAEELIGWVDLGFFKFYVLNDQVETVNSLLVIALIPLWNYALSPIVDYVIYRNRPESAKRKPIHLMLAGLLVAAVAAFLAMNLQHQIDANLPVMEASKVLGLHNPVLFRVENDELASEIQLKKFELVENLGKFIEWDEEHLTSTQLCIGNDDCVDVLDLDKDGKPKNPVKFLYYSNGTLEIEHIDHTLARQNTTSVFDMITGTSQLMKSDEFSQYFPGEKFVDGARIATRINRDDKTATGFVQISEGRTLNVANILPQYIVITFAEILISVTALEFAYTQAPASMKTLTTALWYTTVALANVLNIVLIELGRGSTRSGKLMVSVGAVVVAAVAFYFIGRGYEVLDDKDLVVRFEESTLLDDADSDNVVEARPGRIVLNSAGSCNDALVRSVDVSREEVPKTQGSSPSEV